MNYSRHPLRRAQARYSGKHLGHGEQNITDALNKLMQKQPALIRQVRKDGKTKQARKRYALTDPGRRVVMDLLAGHGAETATDE